MAQPTYKEKYENYWMSGPKVARTARRSSPPKKARFSHVLGGKSLTPGTAACRRAALSRVVCLRDPVFRSPVHLVTHGLSR